MFVGRWKDWNQLKTYLGEGDDDIEHDENGKDPILKFWVFETQATKAWQESGPGGRQFNNTTSSRGICTSQQ